MTAADPRPRDAAVIDIGSNSVRLVFYRIEGRAIWTGHNEKVLAGLGREVARTDRLSPEGVKASLTALKRFRVLLDAVQPSELHVVATAAVREAEDGPDFCDRIAADTGLKVRVLTGEEEARYAALGVLAGSPRAEGLAADLGGSSLELVPIRGGDVGSGVTLPLGPFAVQGSTDPKRELARALASAPKADAEILHAVGGAWRALALLHMRQKGHRLEIVHQYEMSSGEVAELARLMSLQSEESLGRLAKLAKQRAATLPHGARVLAALCERSGAQRVSFSAYGIREGLLLDAMPSDIRALDPLVEGCRALGVRVGLSDGFDRSLAAWLKGALEGQKTFFAPARAARLVEAGAALADIGARLHPDHRADVAFEQVLRAPVPGMDHTERAFLAAAVHARYGGGGLPEHDLALRLLGREGLERARILGLALRLGSDLSGRAPSLLNATRLTRDGDDLVLRAARPQADLLLGEKVNKRLGALANALGLHARLEAA